MTYYDIFRIVTSAGLILTAIGCGDPGVDERNIPEEPATIDPSESGGALLEQEVELACQSACDAMTECPGMHVTIDCVESCIASYASGTTTGDECARAGIDLLNCYSALSCSTSPFDDESECSDAVREVHATCGTEGLRARETPESDRELVLEIGDRSGSDTEAGDEERGSMDDSGAEQAEVTDLADPIVVVEIPDEVLIVDFQWVGVSEDD